MLITEIIVPFLFVVMAVGFLSMCTCCIKVARHTRTLGVIMGDHSNSEPHLSSLKVGMDADMISTFPIIAYSQIKGMKVGRGLLECAVCLSEFHDVDSVRLLPTCDHAFHPQCIDTWLSNHVTCPVCRTNLVGGDEIATESSEMISTGAFTQHNNHGAISTDEAAGPGTHCHNIAMMSA